MANWFSICFISFFSPAFAFAASLSVVSFSGVSSFEKKPHLPMVVFGGVAGPDCSLQADGRSTCDSCQVSEMSCPDSAGVDHAPLCSCNTSRIYNSLKVGITLHRSAGLKGPVLAVVQGNILAVTNSNLIELPWSEICEQMGSPDCSAVGYTRPLTVTLGVDKNENGLLDRGEPVVVITFKVINPGADESVYGEPLAEGIGNFTPFPGDGGVFFTNFQTSLRFSDLAYGSRIKFIRAFASDQSLTGANPVSAIQVFDMPVANDAASVTNTNMTGLNNGTLYFFRLAGVDEAGNVVQFFPSNDNTTPYYTDCIVAPSSQCPYSAIPNSIAAPPDLLSLLEVAIAQNDFKNAKLYASQLKDIDSSFNKIQETPLTLAALNGRADMVSLFLDLGAKVNHQTTNGYSALMFAAISSMSDGDPIKTATVLLARGADKTLRNSDGKTAYDLAVAAGHLNLAKLLK